MSLVIKPGVYRTRGGEKATVFAVNMKGDYSIKGLIHYTDDDMISEWASDGSFYNNRENVREDLVAEWIDTPEVDWSTIPFRFVAMDEDGIWCGYFSKPDQMNGYWEPLKEDYYYNPLCVYHVPEWTGDWKQSLVERPEGK